MIRRFVFSIIVFLVLGLLLSGITDSKVLGVDTNIPDSEVANSINEADNSDSASATITITMYTLPDEQLNTGWRRLGHSYAL